MDEPTEEQRHAYLDPSRSDLDPCALMREVLRLHAAGVQWKAQAEAEAQRAAAAEERAADLQRRLNEALSENHHAREAA